MAVDNQMKDLFLNQMFVNKGLAILRILDKQHGIGNISSPFLTHKMSLQPCGFILMKLP